MGKDIKDLKIVTCHLGNGCSIAAVKTVRLLIQAWSTPLDGFEMGTRCGGIDPSVIISSSRKRVLHLRKQILFSTRNQVLSVFPAFPATTETSEMQLLKATNVQSSQEIFSGIR